MAFTNNPALARALAERNYNDPTPVQTAVLAPETAERDLLVSAQTGSGKTVAYGLAIAETLLEAADRFEPAGAPLALIVAPTRELALQVQREFTWLYAGTGARIVSCVGGMDPRQEQRLLAQGAHIVVGTPGRLRDHLERRRLDISGLKAVVLDEADEMLDLGFREDLEFILQTTPPERRTLLFSATLPRGIAALAKRYQRQAMRIEVGGAEGGHADIEYRAMRITPKDMEQAVVNVLRYFDSPTAIVFCNTRETVRNLHTTLQGRQFSAVALSGELSQNERNHALQALRDGRARVCVATDVAARGIDLPNLGLVVHADLPKDGEGLQHRSGRTGRAGRKGVSVLLVPGSRRRRADDLLRSAGIDPLWSAPPSADDIRKLDHERMLRDPMLTEDVNESDLALGRTLLAAHSAEHIAAALARLYRARLATPEDVVDPGEGRPTRERTPRSKFESRSGDSGSYIWFRLDVGRRKNADPRWLLPLICRRGGVTRTDIGAIRIFDEETAFEVSAAAGEQFAAAVRASAGTDVRIDPLPGGPTQQPESYGKKPYAKPGYGKPERAKPSYDKPKFDRPRDEKPANTPSVDEKPTVESPAVEKPSDGKPNDQRPRHDGARHERPRPEGGKYERPRHEGARHERPAHDKPRYDKPRYDKPKFDKPTFDKPKFEKSTDGKPAFGKFHVKPGGGKFPGKFKGKSDDKPSGKPQGKSFGKSFGKPHGKPHGKPYGKPDGASGGPSRDSNRGKSEFRPRDSGRKPPGKFHGKTTGKIHREP